MCLTLWDCVRHCVLLCLVVCLSDCSSHRGQAEWEAFLGDILARLRDEAVDLSSQLQSSQTVTQADADRNRSRYREITSQILRWLLARQEFERSSQFRRNTMLADLRRQQQDAEPHDRERGRPSDLCAHEAHS